MQAQLMARGTISRFVVPLAFLLLWGASLGPLPFIASAANAQMVLMPGQTYENIPAAGRVVQNPVPVDPLILQQQCLQSGAASLVGAFNSHCSNGTAVAFARQDAYTQLMYVYAQGASARGILFVDFCVPRPGAATCDAVSDPNAPSAPDITVSLTFQYGAIGTAMTVAPFTDAKLALTGSVVDTEKVGFVAFQDLLGNQFSSHGIQFAPVSIEDIPIPLPNFAHANITQPVTFPAMLLKRGRVYRFQLSAAATAENSIVDAYTSGILSCSFSGCERGRLMLGNLTITVGQDIGDLTSQLNDLKSAVSSLQQQMGSLVTRIDDLETSLQNSISALNAAVQSLTARRGRGREHDEREDFRKGHR